MPFLAVHSVFAIAALVLLGAVPLSAQDAVLGQLYGSGVHAYFSQDYVKAHQSFTSAIDGHTQDPRAFYFRGLTLLKLGRPQEAEKDFQRGAELESAIDPTRIYSVARSLERIQGSDRVALEEYRLTARMAVLKKAEDDHRARYEASVREQRAFLQGKAQPVPGEGSKTPDVGPAPADPFMTDGGKTEPKKEPLGGVKPAEPALPTPEIPAEKPAEKPDAGVSPFGPAGAAPAAPSKKSDSTPDPFGGDGLGEPKPAAPGAAPSKKSAAPQGDDDHPFGAPAGPAAAGPAANPIKKPDAAKPDAPAKPEEKKIEDPFGDAGAPAKPAAPAKPEEKKIEDPFGDTGAPDKPAAPAAGSPKKPDAAKPATPEKPDDKKQNDDPFAG